MLDHHFVSKAEAVTAKDDDSNGMEAPGSRTRLNASMLDRKDGKAGPSSSTTSTEHTVMNTHHRSGSNENGGERGAERKGSEQILHTQDTKDHAQADAGNRVRNVGDDVEGWLREYSHDDRMAQTLTLSYETLRTF